MQIFKTGSSGHFFLLGIVSSLSLFTFHSAFTYADQIDPCSLPTQFYSSLKSRHNQIVALNQMPNILQGSAKNIARCTSEYNPQLVACISTAVRKNHHRKLVVFDSHIQREGKYHNHFSVVHYESEDLKEHQYKYLDTPLTLWTNHKFHNDGQPYPGTRVGGHFTELVLNKISGHLSYMSWTSGSPNSMDPKWQLQQEFNFRCEVLD